VNPIPTVTGGTNLVRLLTKELKDITGGLLDVEKDAVKAVDNIENHIVANRKKLGI
jgi:carbon-monoxide dehydrogenase catalytic subunit